MAIRVRSLQRRVERAGLRIDDLHNLTGLSIREIDDALAGRAPVPARLAAMVTLFTSAGQSTRARSLHFFDVPHPWRTIPGFENYEASARGEIRRRSSGGRSIPGTILRARVNRSGYFAVTLYAEDGRQCSIGVHRAVAMAFHGLPAADKTNVCHRDGNRQNNAAENLYWGSPLDNASDRRLHEHARLLVQNPCTTVTSDNIANLKRINKAYMLERVLRRL